MPRTTTGNLLPAQLSDGTQLDTGRDRRYIEVPTQAVMRYFDKVAVKYGNINEDALGVFGKMNVGRDLKARIASLTTPNHLFSNRKNGCAWTPKGKVRLNTMEVDTCPIEINMEQCPDGLWGDCFEMLFGTGNDVRDILGTPEGVALFDMFLRQVYIGIGNSFFMYAMFSNHPMVDEANTLGFWSSVTDSDAWADFHDQMTSTTCGGVVTLLDDLAAEGHPGYDVPISDADFDANEKYTGDIVGFLDGMKAKAKGTFRAMIQSERSATPYRPIFLLSDALFNAYREHIRTTYTGISEGYRHLIQGADGQVVRMQNVLDFDGLPVMRWTASTDFDAVTGATSHRAALIAPGSFGIAYSGEATRQYEGMGLRVMQKLDAPYMGKIYLDTTLRVGAALADTDFIVYGSLLKHP